MGNCNTPTCAIDGKVNPLGPDGLPLDLNPAAINADPCGERGRRGERKNNRENPVAKEPRRDVRFGDDPDGITVERPTAPVASMSAVPAQTLVPAQTMAVVPAQQPAPVSARPLAPVLRPRAVKPGEVVRVQPAPAPQYFDANRGGSTVTLARAGESAAVVRVQPTSVTTPTRTVAAPTDEELARMTPKEREVYLSRARYAASQRNAGAVSALSADDCYRIFLDLAPPAQAAVLTAGILGRYGMTQAVARDISTGAVDAAKIGADWLFASFARDSAEMAQFCEGVSLEAPPAAAGSLIAFQGADQWTRQYRTDQRNFDRRFSSAGELALIDYATAIQLFALLPVDQQASVLSGSAFGDDPYAPALVNALMGTGLIDGVSVSDLLAAHMTQFASDDPHRVLFALAVQDAQLHAPQTSAGDILAPAGVIAVAPRTPARAGTARTAAPPVAAVPSEFLRASGLTAASYASLLARHPDVALQLFHEFEQRPSTFTTVATAALQAIGVVINAVHQGRVDDLSASNAAYLHAQAMQEVNFRIQQSRDSVEIARLQGQATALAATPPQQFQQQQFQQQFPQQQNPNPQQQNGQGNQPWTTSEMALGALVLVALVGGAYFFTKSKPKSNGRRRNRSSRRSR